MASAHASPARLAALIAVLGVAAASAACVDVVATRDAYTERDEQRFTTSASPRLDVTTFDGSIEISTWDRPEVLVVVEKRGADRDAVGSIDVAVVQSGDEITVRASSRSRGDATYGWAPARRATVIATVPTATTVRARSGDGRISVRDLRGAIAVQTGDGSIRIEDVEGAVDAQSGDGSIVVDGSLTRLRARSGDGSVRVRATAGSLAQDDWTISTGDGAITVDLPDDFDAELDAHSGDGRVRVDGLDLRMQRRDGRSTLRGRLGDGGRDLHLRTGDGTIVVRNR